MQFIDVKTDFAFKKIFSNLESKDILINFLNAMLDFKKSPIVDLIIVNPYKISNKIKGNSLHVKANLKNNTIVNIDIQVLNLFKFGKLVLSNWAKSYSMQLEHSNSYHELNPLIVLTISNSIIFKNETLKSVVISHFEILEKQHQIPYLEHDFELVFVELPKFVQTDNELSSIRDKWLFFLKNAGNLQYIPDSLVSEETIKEAFKLADNSNLTLDELEIQETQLRCLNDQLQQEKQEALEKTENIAKEAAKATKLQIAKQMLQANVDIALIRQVLEAAEIEDLSD
jgi:predicted transposase/invertase (TIGR01784 family)